MNDLKPCPFCGREAKIRQVGNSHTKKIRTDIYCCAVGCTVEIRVGSIRHHDHQWTTDKAVEKWNTRHTTEAQIEAAAKAICDKYGFWFDNLTSKQIDFYTRVAKAALKAAGEVNG